MPENHEKNHNSNQKTKAKKLSTSFYFKLGVFAAVFLCVAAFVINLRVQRIIDAKEVFGTYLSMTDHAFSPSDRYLDETNGTMVSCFSYRKEKSDFIASCINFCNVLRDNSDFYKGERSRYILVFKRGIKYFRFDNKKGRAETNVFMEDYSVLEDFEKISCLQIDARFFTAKQLQHLKDISSDYSFEMVIRRDEQIR